MRISNYTNFVELCVTILMDLVHPSKQSWAKVCLKAFAWQIEKEAKSATSMLRPNLPETYSPTRPGCSALIGVVLSKRSVFFFFFFFFFSLSFPDGSALN